MNKKKKHDNYWNFSDGKMNDINHLLHPYPAMLMPLIIRELLKRYGRGSETVILDPYVGSGTTLVEGMLYGAKKVVGIDLNPLAILICKAKTTKYDRNDLKKCIDDAIEKNFTVDYGVNSDSIHRFSIRDSWFKHENSVELDAIKKYIETVKNEDTNLFLKITFSQIVRQVSLTRNGEFKLYRIPKEKVPLHNLNAISMFKALLEVNYKLVLKALDVLNYKTEVDLQILNSTDSYNFENQYSKYDMVITSPPYGDSQTTVAYGQFSRLANEWLEIPDALSLDRRLMGGTPNIDKNYKFDIPVLDEVISKIKTYDEASSTLRYPTVVSFYKDYIESINNVSKTVKDDGYAIYVVGNRRVRNYELPTDEVTVTAFENNGFTHVETIVRDILNKRMPSKASPDNRVGGQIPTMSKEYIVIMRKNSLK